VSIRNYLISVIAVLVVLLALGIWFYPSNGDFRAENSLWNGVKAVTTDYHIQPLDSLAMLPASPFGLSLIVIPYLDFETAELEQLRSFVSQGGRLILADDYGYGNRVLEYLGLEARFSGEMLLDPLVNYKNERLPRITRLQPDVLTTNTDNLVFNHATCLEDVSSNEVLASSSPFSFLDLNGDGTHEDNEPSGPLAVISRHRLGEGQVILIADPSIFINSMDNIEGNAALIHNIAASADTIYIDQSHLEQSELYVSRDWLQKARSLASTPPATAGLVIITLTASLAPVWRRKKEKVG
jgi:hypothetical protein